MTRVNVVPAEELSNQHLMGEYHEITRIFTMTRNAQNRGKNKWNYGIPSEYTLGGGHMKFFSNKLKYILKRYHWLSKELINRGYNISPVPYADLINGIDKHWFGDYNPTEAAIKINRQRIEDRLNGVK